MSLLSCYKTVAGEQLEGGEGIQDTQDPPSGTAGSALLEGKSMQPRAGRGVCQMRYHLSLWQHGTKNVSWLLHLALTFNVTGNPDLQSQQYRVSVSLLSLHH